MSKCRVCGDSVYIAPNGHETAFCAVHLFMMFSRLGVLPNRVAEHRNEAEAEEQKSPSCLSTQHDWKEEYYGYKCERCQMFIPYGSEPWLPVDE